jgi:hypothetical protein
MKQIYGGNHETVANLMSDNVFSVADMDNTSGTISALPRTNDRAFRRHGYAGSHIATAEELFQVMTDIACSTGTCWKGSDPSNQEVDDMVHHIIASLDLRGTGSVQREKRS